MRRPDAVSRARQQLCPNIRNGHQTADWRLPVGNPEAGSRGDVIVGDADFMYCVCVFFVLAETGPDTESASAAARTVAQNDTLSMRVIDASH
jgi:hypothetical protein